MHQLRLGHRAHRHHRPLGVAHIDPIDVVHLVAKRRLGLDVDLPSAAEHVEVVDVEAAQRRLQRIEYVGDLHSEHLRLVAVDVEVDLRRVCGIGAVDAGELGLGIRRHQQAAQRRRDVGGRLALQRLQRVLETAGAAEAENGRQVERERNRALDGRHLRPQLRNDGPDPLRRIGALIVRLEPNDEEGLVRGGDVIDEIEPDHREHALHARDRPHEAFDLLDHRLGAVERNALRKTQRRENRPLVLVRQEALRGPAEQQRRGDNRPGDHHDADDRHAHETAHHPYIAVAGAIDRAQHVAHRTARLLTVREQHPTKRRTQGQRVGGGNQHRDRDRDCKLAEELPAYPGDEGHRHEHREQDERDGDNRAGDLGHRFLAGLRHGKLRILLDHPLDVLDHDDRVVDHDADGEHEGKQRDGIGGIADEEHHGEGADDRHRDGNERDQRRSPPAEEQEHHHAHEHDCDAERANHLLDRLRHEHG